MTGTGSNLTGGMKLTINHGIGIDARASWNHGLEIVCGLLIRPSVALDPLPTSRKLDQVLDCGQTELLSAA